MGNGASRAGKADGGKLGAKITGAMGTVLVLVTLSAAFSVYAVLALTTASPHSTRPDAGAAGEQAAPQIAAFLNELQGLVLEFSRQHDPVAVVRFDGVSEKLLARVQELDRDTRTSNDARLSQAAARIQQLLPPYGSSFRELVKAWETRGLTEDSGLGQKLTEAAGKLGELPAPTSQPQGLSEALTKLSLAEQNYFAARTADNQRLVSKAITALKEAAGTSGLPAPQQQAVAVSVKGYATSFDRYLAVSLATNDPTLSNAFAAEQVRQEEAMHKAALEIEKQIRSLNGAQTGTTAQSLRQLAREYLLQVTPDNTAKLETALRDYEIRLEGSVRTEAQKAAFRQAVADFQSAFAALAEQDKIIAAQQAATDKAHAALQAVVKEIAPKPRPPSALPSLPFPLTPQAALLVMVALWLVTVLVVLLQAKHLAASIRAPLRRITDVARRIATEGNHTLSFPAERHEFGILAAALNELRQQPAGGNAPPSSPSQEQLDDLTLRLKDRRDHDIMVAGVLAGQEDSLARIRSAVAALRSDAATIRETLAGLGEREGTLPQQSGSESAGKPHLDEVRNTLQQSDRLTEVVRDFVDLAEQTSVIALNAAIKSTRTTTPDREFSEVTENLDLLSRRATDAARELNQLLATMSSGLAAGVEVVPTDPSLMRQPESVLAAVADIDRAAVAILDNITAVETQITALDESSSQAGRLLHGLEAMDQEISESMTLLGARLPEGTGSPSRPDATDTDDNRDARSIGASLDLSLEAADQEERS